MPALSIDRITTTFKNTVNKIFTPKEIYGIIANSEDDWQERKQKNNPNQITIKYLSLKNILEVLLKHTELVEVDLPFPYRKLKRYTWGEAGVYEIIQSVDNVGYFSHYSAMELHGLTEQISKTIFFNVEQPASSSGGELTQDAIKRAFSRKCRVSKNVISLNNYRVCKLNGQNTRRLGVINTKISGQNIYVTDIDRTLIDATVRPIYSGGIGEIVKAYRNASSLSIDRIVEYIYKLNFTYPYHQAIGYYLEKTGNYSSNDLNKLRSLPMTYDFYITHQLKNPAYVGEWRLFVPKGF